MCLVNLLRGKRPRRASFFSFTTRPLPLSPLSLIHMHTQIKNFMWTIIYSDANAVRVFFHFPGALLSVSSCLSLALTFLLCLFLSRSPSLPFSLSHSLVLFNSSKKPGPHFLPFKAGSLSSPLVCSKRKKRDWKLLESSVLHSSSFFKCLPKY